MSLEKNLSKKLKKHDSFIPKAFASNTASPCFPEGLHRKLDCLLFWYGKTTTKFVLNKKTSIEALKNQNRLYTSYSKLSEVKLLTIGLASPLRILQWAEKTLPNGKIYGEVLNANTLHHKTFKPQKGGLFCERIFGPLKDFECACGKIDKSVKQDFSQSLLRQSQASSLNTNNETTDKEKTTNLLPSLVNKDSLGNKSTKKINIRKFCPLCDVEYTWSVIRRYQLGYIKLISPVTHLWYLKGTPSYLSLLLDIKKRHLQFVTYCSETLTLENSLSQNNKYLIVDSPSKIFESWKNIVENKNSSNLNDNSSDEKSKKSKKSKKRILKEATRNKDWKKQNFTFDELKNNQKYSETLVNDLEYPIFFEKDKNVSFSFIKKTVSIKDNYSISSLNEKVDLSYLKNLAVSNNDLILKKDLKSFKTLEQNQIYLKNKNSEISKKEFKLNNLLLCLQLSILYNSFSLNNHEKVSNILLEKIKSSIFLSNNILENQFFLYNNLQKIHAKKNSSKKSKLNSLLYKISQKLPVESYISFALEQKIQKKGLGEAIHKSWIFIYQKGFVKTLNKVNIIKTKYNNNLMSHYSLPRREEREDKNKKIFLNILKENPEMKSSLQKIYLLVKNSKLIQKKFVYTKMTTNLINFLEKLQKYYLKKVLQLLTKTKQPIFTKKYYSDINNNYDQMILLFSKDISFLLKDELNWMIKLSSNFLSKNILFGHYLQNLKFSISKVTNDPLRGAYDKTVSAEGNGTVLDVKINEREKLKTKYQTILSSLLSNYSNFSIFEKIKTDKFNKRNKKQYPLELADIKKTIKSKKEIDYKNKQKIFNTVYTVSHRERWETEKDWYIFSLFNSAVADYTDIPINIYKNRLFSFSFDFVQELGTQNNLNQTLSSSSFYSGPGIVKQLLNEFDFSEIKKLDKQNRLLLYQLNKNIFKLKKQLQVFVYDKIAKNDLKDLCKRRDLLIRRTKLVRKLFRKNSDPGSMILTILPVLPPDLRPIVKMGGQIAASDLNRLYQRVIYRNERLKKFLKDPATSQSYEMKYAQRLLQESVDNLIQNGKSGINSEKDARGRALKSLSDSLKGKQGRFRQFLLGKRVDYSGRSVIVVGPKLKLHECGLPIEMAKELYLPFLLKTILNKNYAKTVIGAKALIRKNPALTSELLREIMQISPVLLNRAPTLHRLGFQAFVPKLIEGRAILLHPLVCSAFNADFDGDQMAVHVPITIEARAEAWKLMLSKNNILSPATGEPLAIPSQDMVLGCYYLTTYSNKGTIPLLKGSGTFFNNFDDVINAYHKNQINIHAAIWVKWSGLIQNGIDQEEPVEIRLTSEGQWQEISVNYYRIYDSHNNLVTQYVKTTPGRILFNSFITKNMI